MSTFHESNGNNEEKNGHGRVDEGLSEASKSQKLKRPLNTTNKFYKSTNLLKKYHLPKKIGPFLVKNDAIYVKEYDEEKKQEVDKKVANLAFIKEIHQDVESQSVDLELAFFYRGEYKTITISRKQLLKNELIKLLEYGVDVPDYKAPRVQYFLNLQEELAPYVHTHKQLGWSEINGSEVFKHMHSIGDSDITSRYNGPFQIKSKGTYNEWKKLIEVDVVPHTPLCLALTAGFAAPIVAWLAKELDLEVILIHAFGDSTMGKTTAARVYVSPFGAPTTKEGGCLLKWNGTQNGIIAQLVGNHGVPLAIDEASMNKMRDFTEILYVLAEGMEKARMTKELNLRERRKWSGVLWSTAEHQLLQKTNQNTGIKVRLTEIGHVPWTDSAEHADRIKKGLLQNYGHAGPTFVEFIQKLGKQEILTRWNKWKNQCMEAMTIKDQFSQRIGDKLALMLATAELVNECFDFEINVESILELLIEVEQESAGERSVGDLAYTYFQQQLIQHKSKFEFKDEAEKGYEYWGRIQKKNGKNEVAILPTVFKKIMTEGNFEDTDVILRHWRDKGYLEHDHNKLTRRRAAIKPVEEEQKLTTKKGKEQRELFYCIKVPSDLFQVSISEIPPHPKERMVRYPRPTKKRIVPFDDFFDSHA